MTPSETPTCHIYRGTMISAPDLLSGATFVAVALLVYLCIAARRSGLKQKQEYWMVFGLVPVIIAGDGITRQNQWVSVIALLLAIVGLAFHARQYLRAAERKKPPVGS